MHWWNWFIVIFGAAVGLILVFRPKWLWKDWLGAPASREKLTDDRKEGMKVVGTVMLTSSAMVAGSKDMLGNWGVCLPVVIGVLSLVRLLRKSK